MNVPGTGIQVIRGQFPTREAALLDIIRQGLWPTTLVTPAGAELPLHRHDSEVQAYVLEGRSWIRDGVTGEKLAIEPGDKLVIPDGAVHAEGETSEPMLYIVALPAPRSPKAFLRMYPPDDANASGAAP